MISMISIPGSVLKIWISAPGVGGGGGTSYTPNANMANTPNVNMADHSVGTQNKS